jgi:hypothetical protein
MIDDPILPLELQPPPSPEVAPQMLEISVLCLSSECIDTAVTLEEGGAPHSCVRPVWHYRFVSPLYPRDTTPYLEMTIKCMENAKFTPGQTYKVELK